MKVSHSTFGQHLTGAILVQGGIFITIHDNEIYGGLFTGGVGVQIAPGFSDNALIHHNLINNGIIGVVVQGDGNIVVDGNTFSNWTNCCVQVAGGTLGLIVSNNMMYLNNTGSVVMLSGASDYYNIVNNIIHGVAISDSGSGAHKTISGNN